MDCLRITSPIIKLNLHGNYLFLASHDCHVTIVELGLHALPNKGEDNNIVVVVLLCVCIVCVWL